MNNFRVTLKAICGLAFIAIVFHFIFYWANAVNVVLYDIDSLFYLKRAHFYYIYLPICSAIMIFMLYFIFIKSSKLIAALSFFIQLLICVSIYLVLLWLLGNKESSPLFFYPYTNNPDYYYSHMSMWFWEIYSEIFYPTAQFNTKFSPVNCLNIVVYFVTLTGYFALGKFRRNKLKTKNFAEPVKNNHETTPTSS